MVRTKANNAAVRKAVAAKAPRKHLGAGTRQVSTVVSPSSANKRGKKKASSNPVRPWPTPDWQKGIDAFLSVKEKDDSCSSKVRPSTPEDSSSNKENIQLNDSCTSIEEQVNKQPASATSDGEEMEEEEATSSEEEEEEDLMSESEEESEIDEKETATSKIASLGDDLVSAGEDN